MLSSCGRVPGEHLYSAQRECSVRQVGECLQVAKAAQLGRVVLERERFIILGLDATAVVGHLYQLAAILLEPHLGGPTRQLRGRP